MEFSGDFGGLVALANQLEAVAHSGAQRIGDAVAEAIELKLDEGFARGTAPDGDRWPAKKSYSGPGPLLGGRMASSAKAVCAGGIVSASVSGPFADVQQSGMTIKAKETNPRGLMIWAYGAAKQVTIPPRRMLPPESSLPGPWASASEAAATVCLGAMLK